MPSVPGQSVSSHTCQGRRVALAGCLILAACSETVVLGTECPGSPGVCVLDSGAGPSSDGAAETPDGDTPDGGSSTVDDAQAGAPDASAPAEGGALTTVANGSFELQANGAFSDPTSQFGKDVFVGTVGSAVPVADALFANLQPWYACLPGTQAVRATSSGEGATDGMGFGEAAGGLRALSPGLYQRLPVPLAAGNTYHFTIDLYGISNDSTALALQLGAGTQACAGFATSATTPRLRDGMWETYCLTLRPSEPLDILGVLPINLGGLAELGFDNLKSVRSCP